MGCCFSKELNPGQQNERSSLLQSRLHDGLSEVTEQVRQHAAAVAQHVSLEEEETCVPNGPAQRKPLEEEERHPELDSKVCTEVAVASTTASQRDLKPASTDEEKEAIIITTSTHIHTNTDTEAGVAHTAGPSCEPAPYMEVPTQSPVRQKILENATLKASWFTQLPEGQKWHKPASSWSAPARLASAARPGNATASEVSGDQPPPPPLSACQGTQPVSPEAEHKDEEGEEVCVVTTLCQGFETRTQSFYSICSIDADDLEHDHDHSQSQTAGATQSLHTAEAETAALPCTLESPLPSQSHTDASTASDQTHVTESKMTSWSHDEEAAPTLSHAAEQSSTILSHTHSSTSVSAEQTTSPPPVVPPLLVDPVSDPLPPPSSQRKDEDPQGSVSHGPQPEDLSCQTAAKDTDESQADMSSVCVESETVKEPEEITVTEECVCGQSVCSEEQSVHLEDHSAAEGVLNATEETVADFQERELDQRVDSELNPLDDHLHESDLTETHIQSSQPATETPELDTSSQSPTSSTLDLKLLHEQESDVLPLCGGRAEMDKSSLQSQPIPVSICKSHSEEADVVYSSTAGTTLTEVSSVSTISAGASLPIELTAFSCYTNLTPPSDLTKTTSPQCDSITSDKLDVNSNDPTFDLSSVKPSTQAAEESELSDSRFDRCDKQMDGSDVKTEGEPVSGSDELFHDVLMSGDDRKAAKKTNPEFRQSSKQVEGGDVTVDLTETGQNTSHLETSEEKCDVHGDNSVAVNTGITLQDPEDLESSIKDSSLSPPTQPPPTENELPVITPSTPPPPPPSSSSPCLSFEKGEQSFSAATVSENSQIPGEGKSSRDSVCV
ncbi:uncharacterized protein LOC108885056 isoform X1 [Lates calcarifer]|uniref:Uncharacterized protein LOC108885056 isoform X1 n=1 Tax=Lates calcarifer TaxID=8187 RepID=A0AAJ7LZE9_LATCA|nr:uncharacterized protein LOC108885056 isoform X1 [Lates calcarifer]